ncbi:MULTISPECIES: hypothetical protein [unclassified Corallococcus]|uniref:hypothetical protein n=1 Tax=unclassified Corallococcus TaxID=2685029 RepID=UPI001A8DDC15|nr:MULTISPECIES: hypothetical protein [unclassified Corallococcus]MBN9687840.1 hypothetical protein [Corallococcus sp. NCSPR001]WAS88348.1 hypothetical protein O0N60_15490 [Corallococcus sp. NCRR]
MARLLIVNDVTYRWNFQRKRVVLEGTAWRLLTVVWAEATRQALHVRVRHDDPWLHVDDGDTSGLVTRDVGPGLVARVIEMARGLGWSPEKRGSTLKFVLEDDARLVPVPSTGER